jgi:hypothetical protein
MKRSLDFDAATGRRTVDPMTHHDMVEATATGRGTKLAREYAVTILDVFRNVAIAKVDSPEHRIRSFSTRPPRS